MSITIGGYSFDGPYYSTGDLQDRAGVYAILAEGTQYQLLDCGESGQVKTRVESHDRADSWTKKCPNGSKLCCAVYYTPNTQQAGRMAIEQTIRTKYNPPCGER